MKILITGVCGFVGAVLASELLNMFDRLEIIGLDNFSRPGSEQNRHTCQQRGVRFVHGDIRNSSDVEPLPKVDWVIDAAANPSVLAGIGGATSSRQLMEHNLVGTLQLLEFCKRHTAGLILLSTSRVYSQARLASLPMELKDSALIPAFKRAQEIGLSENGVAEGFSTQPPLSLYGCAKRASETVAQEYGLTFGFPVQVNRCGVLAGAGQFGKADQGIFSYWLHRYRNRRPLRYIGFGGTGNQVRDCLHPRDLARLIALQLQNPEKTGEVINASGGTTNAISLAGLSEWCAKRFGHHEIGRDSEPRPFDVPWLVLDSRRAEALWNWRPQIRLENILTEIADHADRHPEWLELSEGG